MMAKVKEDSQEYAKPFEGRDFMRPFARGECGTPEAADYNYMRLVVRRTETCSEEAKACVRSENSSKIH